MIIFKNLKNITNGKFFRFSNAKLLFGSFKLPVKSFCENTSAKVNEIFLPENTKNFEQNLPINKEEIIEESEEVLEYTKILNTMKKLMIEFDHINFKKVVNFIQENQINDIYIFKDFEEILINNINMIDCETKSLAVLILGRAVHKKKLNLENIIGSSYSKIFYHLLIICFLMSITII